MCKDADERIVDRAKLLDRFMRPPEEALDEPRAASELRERA